LLLISLIINSNPRRISLDAIEKSLSVYTTVLLPENILTPLREILMVSSLDILGDGTPRRRSRSLHALSNLRHEVCGDIQLYVSNTTWHELCHAISQFISQFFFMDMSWMDTDGLYLCFY
jgi:hypothetical protein